MEQLPGPWLRPRDLNGWLLDKGYWASYNRIFDAELFALFAVANQSALIAAYGAHFSWANTSRARIFEREQGGVADLPALQRLLRYNEFQVDPLGGQSCTARASASNAIAERGDLTPASSRCIADISRQDEAAIDAKVTSHALVTSGRLAALAVSGPTAESQPPFRWSTSPYSATPHAGQPDLWDFAWQRMEGL